MAEVRCSVVKNPGQRLLDTSAPVVIRANTLVNVRVSLQVENRPGASLHHLKGVPGVRGQSPCMLGARRF